MRWRERRTMRKWLQIQPIHLYPERGEIDGLLHRFRIPEAVAVVFFLFVKHDAHAMPEHLCG
jgi:hypothetical protein